MDINDPREDINISSTENQVEKLCYIYKHIRLDRNEVFYIGKGTNSDRKYKRSKSMDSRNKYWKRIVKKHGYKIEIIIDNLSEDEANETEVYYILHYGRIDLGTGTLVNMTSGGEGMCGISEETRQKRSASNRGNKNGLGYKHTNESLKKMSDSQKGKTVSEETRKKMRNTSLCKKVCQYKDGNLIKEYPSMNSVELDGFDRSSVGKCCNGKAKSHKGYIWKFTVDEGVKEITNRTISKATLEKMSKAQKYKPVRQYNSDGNLIKEYHSIASTKIDGFIPEYVGKCCRGKQKSYKGYIWKFL